MKQCLYEVDLEMFINRSMEKFFSSKDFTFIGTWYVNIDYWKRSTMVNTWKLFKGEVSFPLRNTEQLRELSEATVPYITYM